MGSMDCVRNAARGEAQGRIEGSSQLRDVFGRLTGQRQPDRPNRQTPFREAKETTVHPRLGREGPQGNVKPHH